jgi:phosphatidylglycerol:prolipoprotein diacylglycerol transferase
MHPTLFTIGNLQVPTYTVLLDLGLILGLLLAYYEGKRQLNRGAVALDLGLWAVIGGILGGRIGYVLAKLGVFSEDWASAIRIWEGGLSFHGALLGGLLIMILFAYLQKREEAPLSFWQLADLIVPGLALGVTFGWVACLMGGCAYGIPGEGLGYAILPGIYGEASRFATQAVGTGISLILFLGVWLTRRRWPFAGASFLLYALLYFASQFFLEFTRGDEAIYVGSWRLAQVLNLALVVIAAVGLLVLWWRWSTAEEDREDSAGEESESSGDATETAADEDVDQELVVEEPAPALEMPAEGDEPAEDDGMGSDAGSGEPGSP